ncbi:hypothetical protein [Bacillus altitudinis]|uniref:Uncharacterized protein n=1 Tax=Bacillus altitudinis TaxID=293387 RepID=A0ABV1S2J0_BACAB|nr:hypothetical protein [Bacillus altitudinis]MCY7579353.1 hypothetical protein [Bacillus altitudinis]MCY7594664.1 hypothetical protein [Bacillus altitudinis]WJE31540.1 hypothetical protein QRD87_06590 [Bacillus altitudinis]
MKVLRFEYEKNRFKLYAMFMDDISTMRDDDIQRDMLNKSKNIVKAGLGFEGYLNQEYFSTYEETNSVYCSYTF